MFGQAVNASTQRHPEWIDVIHLSHKESRAVKDGLMHMSSTITSEIDVMNRAVMIAQLLEGVLRDETVNRIKSYRVSAELKAQVIHGWPLDTSSLPVTPVIDDPTVRSIHAALVIQPALALLRKEYPVSYITENHGKLYRHVTSKLGFHHAESSHGSLQPLGPHTDLQHRPIAGVEQRSMTPAPQTLTLYACRVDLGTPTLFADGDLILKQMPIRYADRLTHSRYIVSPPQSTSGESEIHEIPLFYHTQEEVLMRFGGKVSSRDRKCAVALKALAKTLAENELWTPLQLLPGSTLSWKNNALLHARYGFQPRFAGHDRWFVRMYSLEQRFLRAAYPETPWLSA